MTDMTMTMKLNHLSFPSTDVAATAAFFEQQLGCASATRGPGSRILKRPGFDIVIDDASGHDMTWPHNFHIGFELPSVDHCTHCIITANSAAFSPRLPLPGLPGPDHRGKGAASAAPGRRSR